MRAGIVLVLLLGAVGCAKPQAATPARVAPQRVISTELDAYVAPPPGWRADPLKTSNQHKHQVWISPVGGTAYGVIAFSLPLPVGEDIALWGFLREMKSSEGEAVLLSKNRAGDRLTFLAEGGKYRIRGIIVTRGFRGWAVYAGNLRDRPVQLDDLELAVQARDNTALGLRVETLPSPKGPTTSAAQGQLPAGRASPKFR